MSLWRALGTAALDLLSPRACPGCGSGLLEREIFCATCELAIAPRDPADCPSCGRTARASGLCRGCERRQLPLSAVQATFEYEGPVAVAIQAIKYRRRDDLVAPLARRWLAERFEARAELHRHVVAPVPLHPKRLASRGFDQAWLLAQQLARAAKLEARPRLLRRTRHTAAQVGLGRAAREANVRSAFAADPSARGIDVLLVDDVFTTGATLRACADALVQAGARSVLALAVARAQP